jgi:hypothetical protein
MPRRKNASTLFKALDRMFALANGGLTDKRLFRLL